MSFTICPDPSVCPHHQWATKDHPERLCSMCKEKKENLDRKEAVKKAHETPIQRT